jgi:hypothetical protein
VTPRLSGPESLRQGVEQLARFVEMSAQDGTAAHVVEDGIWRQLLGLGRMALGHFFDQVGDGDLGEEVTLSDESIVRRLLFPHTRPYQSIFGPFEISRAVYGSREGQKIEWVPLDQRLDLPESKFSYLLQDWDQHLVVENPYASVNRTLERILGFSQSIDSLERMSRKMAAPVVDFLDTLPSPAADEEGELMVLSADGKGIPIRRQAEKGPITASPAIRWTATGELQKMSSAPCSGCQRLRIRRSRGSVHSTSGCARAWSDLRMAIPSPPWPRSSAGWTRRGRHATQTPPSL